MRCPRAGVAFVVLALGLASSLEACLTIEWWSPGCYDPSRWDGPVPVAFGAPLPYARFSGYSSLTYVVMPHVVLLDVVLLASVIAAPLLMLPRRLPAFSKRWSSVLAKLGLTLLLLRLAWWGLMLCAGLYVPVMSIGGSVHHRYGELRPVGLATDWRYFCEP